MDWLKEIKKRDKHLPSTAWSYKAGQARFGLDVAFSQSPDFDESRMSATFPFASGVRRDGVGDLLEVEGIGTERHRLNPIVLHDHGKQIPLPVALAEDPDTGEYTVSIDPQEKVAKVRAFFYQGKGKGFGNPPSEHALFCEQLYDLFCRKYVRSGSIGYSVRMARQLPPDYATGTPGGMHLLKTLLLEASLVVLPANMDTVVKVFSMPTICGKRLSPYLVKSLSPYLPEKRAMLFIDGKAHSSRVPRDTHPVRGFIRNQSGPHTPVGEGRVIPAGEAVEVLNADTSWGPMYPRVRVASDGREEIIHIEDTVDPSTGGRRVMPHPRLEEKAYKKTTAEERVRAKREMGRKVAQAQEDQRREPTKKALIDSFQKQLEVIAFLQEGLQKALKEGDRARVRNSDFRDKKVVTEDFTGTYHEPGEHQINGHPPFNLSEPMVEENPRSWRPVIEGSIRQRVEPAPEEKALGEDGLSAYEKAINHITGVDDSPPAEDDYMYEHGRRIGREGKPLPSIERFFLVDNEGNEQSTPMTRGHAHANAGEVEPEEMSETDQYLRKRDRLAQQQGKALGKHPKPKSAIKKTKKKILPNLLRDTWKKKALEQEEKAIEEGDTVRLRRSLGGDKKRSYEVHGTYRDDPDYGPHVDLDPDDPAGYDTHWAGSVYDRLDLTGLVEPEEETKAPTATELRGKKTIHPEAAEQMAEADKKGRRYHPPIPGARIGMGGATEGGRLVTRGDLPIEDLDDTTKEAVRLIDSQQGKALKPKSKETGRKTSKKGKKGKYPDGGKSSYRNRQHDVDELTKKFQATQRGIARMTDSLRKLVQ